MHKLFIMQYLNRMMDEAENSIIEEKNRVHWRKATSEDYLNIMFAYYRYELISKIVFDIYRIFSLYP